MADEELGSALRRVLRMVSAGPGSGQSDSELLERFVATRDEAAFEVLLGRHGPMVLNTCRRFLRRPQDAEDAFQATFLVFSRKAHAIRRRQSVGGWLYRIAYRTARTAQARVASRTTQGIPLEDPSAPEPPAALVWQDLRPVLDEELDRLPEKYRTPLVLHYFEGKTVEQAAHDLGWPTGTVAGRLARGKDLLRRRLVRRGVALSTATLGSALAREATAGLLPAAYLHATARAVLAGTASGQVTGLTQAVLGSLAPDRSKAVAFLLLAFGAIAVGAAVFHHTPADNRLTSKLPPAGDPLPAGARLRLGSERFRHGYGLTPVAYSPDGKTLASVGAEGLVRLWDAVTGLTRATLRHRPDSWLFTLAFSPDGRTLAAGGKDTAAKAGRSTSGPSTVVLWDVASGVPWRTFTVPGQIYQVTFSPDGRRLAAAGEFEDIRIWDVSRGVAFRSIKAPLSGVKEYPLALAFLPDGHTLAAVVPGEVCLWDTDSGQERHRLGAGNGRVQSFAISRDGRLLVCGNEGPAMGLWDLTTGWELHQYVHGHPARRAGYSSDDPRE
jgi:RNA polymerase sigma factor (sigma-70 family)